MHSQNNKEEIILNYFQEKKDENSYPAFLDLGAYDGIDLSNTRALTELGWAGVCVEPNPEIFQRLVENNKFFPKILNYEIAISTSDGIIEMNANNSYYSTLVDAEVEKWKAIEQFNKIKVRSMTWDRFYRIICLRNHFDFISIDCEGMDYEILTQMNLDELRCKMICIETNGIQTQKYIDYISKFDGFKVISTNPENLIMAK